MSGLTSLSVEDPPPATRVKMTKIWTGVKGVSTPNQLGQFDIFTVSNLIDHNHRHNHHHRRHHNHQYHRC